MYLVDLQEQVGGHGVVEEQRVAPVLGRGSLARPPPSHQPLLILRLASVLSRSSVLAPGPAVTEDRRRSERTISAPHHHHAKSVRHFLKSRVSIFCHTNYFVTYDTEVKQAAVYLAKFANL